ncbi:MAG: penicillin-binding protein 1C [Candidatus Peribacteraceae bacterium]
MRKETEETEETEESVKATPRNRRTLRILSGVLVAAAIAILAWPLPPALLHPVPQQAVQILDREGRLLYEARGAESGSFRFIPLADLPPSLTSAFLAIEDRRFYEHGGVDYRAIARAAWQNIAAGEIISGGSTLTQQLVRNILHPRRRTFPYKAREALLAWKLEWMRSKEQILEAYLNTVPFGHQAYGIAAASRIYFDKAPQELSTAESALLAGLVQSPSSLDPYKNPARAKERQKMVLAAMREAGVIGAAQEGEALAEPLRYAHGKVLIQAPHFAFWVQEERPRAFEEGGEVRTTLDLSLQREVEEIVTRKLAELHDLNVTSAAVVVLDARQGDILAMVGSADYFDAEHDGAVNVALSPRQPGSALKPFTYALALARGETAATTVGDIETQFYTQEGNPYVPRNYDYGYHGLVRYREALANSYNIAAVRVLEKVGVPELLDFLRSIGIGTLTEKPEHYGLALTLGDAEVTLLDLTRAYGMLARGGVTLTPRLAPEDPVLPGERVLDERVAWLITDILSDESARLPEFGADSPLSIGRPVAAKTGTTRNSRDNWTMGYTPDVIVGVWVGNADNSPMRGTSGVTGAGPIFHDVMLAVTSNKVIQEFPRPQGLIKKSVCRLSGKLPTQDCPHTIEEWFIAGTEPTEDDDVYQRIVIDTRNGLLAPGGADTSCPPAVTESRVFTVFPPELTAWARENGYTAPPRELSPLCGTASVAADGGGEAGDPSTQDSASPWLTILKPQQGDSFRLDPLVPDANEKIIFRAEAHPSVRTVTWYVNGKEVGQGTAPAFRFDWPPRIGQFTIEARGGGLHEVRRIEVVE